MLNIKYQLAKYKVSNKLNVKHSLEVLSYLLCSQAVLSVSYRDLLSVSYCGSAGSIFERLESLYFTGKIKLHLVCSQARGGYILLAPLNIKLLV